MENSVQYVDKCHKQLHCVFIDIRFAQLTIVSIIVTMTFIFSYPHAFLLAGSSLSLVIMSGQPVSSGSVQGDTG